MSEIPEIIYKDENCFITDQQKLSEFPNYSISNTGIIVCNSDIGNHHRGDFWNVQKKISISLYDRNGQKVKVDLLILMAREFIGVDTTGTYAPIMKSQAGLMIASNITYHYNSLKKISNKSIEVDGIKYHKVSKSKYTYISKDGIAFNYQTKDFQIRRVQSNGDCEIKLDMTNDGVFSYQKVQFIVFDTYHTKFDHTVGIIHNDEDKNNNSYINIIMSNPHPEYVRIMHDEYMPSKRKDGPYNYRIWLSYEAEIVAYMMSKGFGYKDITEILDENKLAKCDFNDEAVRMLMNTFRKPPQKNRNGFYIWLSDKYGLLGMPIHSRGNRVMIIKTIPSVLKFYKQIEGKEYKTKKY